MADDPRPVNWYRSARKHRIGRAHAITVMTSTDALRVPGTDGLADRLVWVGPDDRGLTLEVVALDLPDQIIVIHVMPYSFRRRQEGQ